MVRRVTMKPRFCETDSPNVMCRSADGIDVRWKRVPEACSSGVAVRSRSRCAAISAPRLSGRSDASASGSSVGINDPAQAPKQRLERGSHGVESRAFRALPRRERCRVRDVDVRCGRARCAARVRADADDVHLAPLAGGWGVDAAHDHVFADARAPGSRVDEDGPWLVDGQRRYRLGETAVDA